MAKSQPGVFVLRLVHGLEDLEMVGEYEDAEQIENLRDHDKDGGFFADYYRLSVDWKKRTVNLAQVLREP